jgi:hypothetical protein
MGNRRGNLKLCVASRREARQGHNLKVIGSNPIPATKLSPLEQRVIAALTGFFIRSESFPEHTKGTRVLSDV